MPEEQLELFYEDLKKQLMKIKVPVTISLPSNNPFLDKSTSTNYISTMFSELNRIVNILNGNGVKIKKLDSYGFIKRMRKPSTDREKLVSIVLDAYSIFEDKRGECLNVLNKKILDISSM